MQRILIAEDEPRIAAFLEKGLLKNGYRVVVATTGNEALELIQSSSFDMLLLDLGLPGKDGWAVMDELAQMNYSLPIIVVSAWEGVDAQLKRQHREPIDYITKPFRFNVLLEKIRAQLGHR